MAGYIFAEFAYAVNTVLVEESKRCVFRQEERDQAFRRRNQTRILFAKERCSAHGHWQPFQKAPSQLDLYTVF